MDRICPRCHRRFPAATERCPTHDLPLRTDPFIGTQVGRWTLTSFIGQGAMGVVYRGDPPAAIKILNARRAAMQPDLVRRFEVEAEAAIRLQSPHIAKVFDSGTTDDGHLYIAMELLRGAPLDEILQRMNRVAADGAATIAYQAAHALAEAHDKAIVHRDLKPANLFAEPSGDGGAHIRVLDFGVARINTDSVARSRTGSVVGTPAYMSPEQLRGEPDIDGRSDVYSLGVVLYRMLAGFNPFRGDGGMIDTLRRHIEVTPPPLPPDVPPTLAELTFDMLAKHRDARPPSMHAVRARLEGSGLVVPASEATVELAPIPNLDTLVIDPSTRASETTTGAGEVHDPQATPARRRRWLAPTAALILVAGAAWALLTDREAEPPERFVIESRLLDTGVTAATTPTTRPMPDDSPPPTAAPDPPATPPAPVTAAPRPSLPPPVPAAAAAVAPDPPPAPSRPASRTVAPSSPQPPVPDASKAVTPARPKRPSTSRASARPDPREYNSFIERGLKALGRGDRAAAAVLFERAREAKPASKVPYQRLCAVYKAQDDFARALPNCERWLTLEDNVSYRSAIQRTIDQLRDRLTHPP